MQVRARLGPRSGRDCALELGLVALVLVGVGLGERSKRLVELPARAE
jgi:hypothetical protein